MTDIEHIQSIVTTDDHIYFYSDIDPDSAVKLIQTLHDLDMQKQINCLKRGGKPKPIYLHINCPGGEISSAFAIAGHISQLETPIYSIVEGQAASGGVIVSRACKKSYILSHSLMMIHQPAIFNFVPTTETKNNVADTLACLDKWTDILVEFLSDRTHMSKKKVREYIDRDTWITANEAVELGLVDKIKGK